MNRRDLLKGLLAAPVVVALGDGAEASYQLTREMAPLYTMGDAKPDPVDYKLIEDVHELVRRARKLVGLQGTVQIVACNLGFRESSHVADVAIAMQGDISFRQRKGNSKMVSVLGCRLGFKPGKKKLSGKNEAAFIPVVHEIIRVGADGKHRRQAEMCGDYGASRVYGSTYKDRFLK